MWNSNSKDMSLNEGVEISMALWYGGADACINN